MSDINIGPLSGSQTIAGFVGSGEPEDYFNLSLSTPSSFSVSLAGMGADVQILDSSGAILYEALVSDLNSGAINIDELAAGDYKVKVFATGGETEYTLSLKADALTGMTHEEVNAPGGSGIEPDGSIIDGSQQPDESTGTPVAVSPDGGDASNENQTLRIEEEETQLQPETLSPDGGDASNENQTLGTQPEETEPQAQPTAAPNPFTSGTFVADLTGQVGIDYLFDGGGYQGQVAIASLKGMEAFEPGSEAFIKEFARRALSSSELGHLVISDLTDAARFSGELGENNWNAGTYSGVRMFAMTPGDEFGVMLVPNGTVQEVFDNPAVGGDKRPLFSMATANPNQAFHFGQMADVTGEGNTFTMEDLRVDGWTDKDYNDFVFQVRGALGKAALMDDVVAPQRDWRGSDLGQALIEYAVAYVTPEPVQDEGAVEPEVALEPTDPTKNDPAVVDTEPTGSEAGAIAPDAPTGEPIDLPQATPIGDKPVESGGTVAESTISDKPVNSVVTAPKTPISDKLVESVGTAPEASISDKPAEPVAGSTEVAGDKPVEPVGVAETTPIVDKPVEPGAVIPVPAIIDKPVEPGAVIPETPIIDKPVESVGVDRETPLAHKPVEPGAVIPVAAIIDKPVEPDAVIPVAAIIDKPVEPDAVIPETPIIDKPVESVGVAEETAIIDKPVEPGAVTEQEQTLEKPVEPQVDKPVEPTVETAQAPAVAAQPTVGEKDLLTDGNASNSDIVNTNLAASLQQNSSNVELKDILTGENKAITASLTLTAAASRAQQPSAAKPVSKPLQFDFPKSAQPLVGVIDTGFAANNIDIDSSRITLGSDRVAGDANPLLQSGEASEHGTHVLGIIAATRNNGVGIDGINDQATVWLGRAIGSSKWAESLVEFVDAAKDSGQSNAVVNLSFDLTQINPDGSVTTRTELTLAERGSLEYARQNNVLVVVSSGNQGSEMSALGKASLEFDNIITVGAAQRLNVDASVASAKAYVRAEYSSYGKGLDIMADGGTPENPVISTEGNSTGTGFGTSVATAKVTGAASQVWAANPNLSYRQVIDILKRTATDFQTPNWDAETGKGLINIAAAVQLAKATAPESNLSPTRLAKLPDLKNPVLGSTQADDGIVYLSTSSGQILRTDTQTGQQSQVYQGRSFTDIALAPSGKLYGSTFDRLFAIDPATGQETAVGRFATGQSINALTFSPDGKLYGADSQTGKLFLIAPDTAKTVEVGSLGGASSGDILFNGSHQILATVKNWNGDQLVSVNTATGQSEIIGNLGFRDVYGLALLDGVLTAFTADGRKLEVDPRTGAATVVGLLSTAGQIWGAADNPSSSGIWVGNLPELLEPGQVDPTRAPIPTERETNSTNPQAYQFQDPDSATWWNGVGEVPLSQYWDRPPQNVTNAFKWIYNSRYAGQFGSPSGPTRRRQIAGQWVWIQEFARGGSSNSRGVIIMRDSDRNRTDYENVAYGLVGKPLERWRIGNMGLPKGNSYTATRSPRGTEGWWMPFENGSLHWTKPNNNSFALWYDYQAEYNRLGGSGGWLGFPTSEPVFWTQYLGRNWDVAQFEGGFMVWASGLGAFSFSWQDYNNANGAIWNLFWNAVAAGLNRNQIQALLNAYPPQGPWSTQTLGSLKWQSGPNGSGWVQEFNGPAGKRLLMLENGKNEAFWVFGDNYREYIEMGGPTGTLGFPRSNENLLNRPDGRYATWQAFSASNGKARIHHLGRSVATWGSIGSFYTDLGGAHHWLGMPTRREYIDGDTIFSDFEGGRIAFNRNDGRTEALRPGQQPSWRPLFDIKPTFAGNLRSSARNVINDAINTWKSIISRGPIGSPVQTGFNVRIYESNESGYAGGSYAQNGSGEIDLTPAFFALSYAHQKKVLMHELGHVMGFGHQTASHYWNKVQKIGSSYYFTGANAKAIYGGNLPLEGNFNGTGSGWHHWQENNSKLRYDLMSPQTNEGYSSSDLKYTLAAFKDMGFELAG